MKYSKPELLAVETALAAIRVERCGPTSTARISILLPRLTKWMNRLLDRSGRPRQRRLSFCRDPGAGETRHTTVPT